MGASIHMHIEVKHDGYWVHYSAPSMMRDPLFFDLVAGIYGKTINPIVPPKGLPGDISFLTAYCLAMDEKNHTRIHHKGWLSSKELLVLQEQLILLQPEKTAFEADLEEKYLHCYINDNAIASHQGFEDSRLVFWFNS